MPSILVPKNDHAVITFPKIAAAIMPRSRIIPPQRA